MCSVHRARFWVSRIISVFWECNQTLTSCFSQLGLSVVAQNVKHSLSFRPLDILPSLPQIYPPFFTPSYKLQHWLKTQPNLFPGVNSMLYTQSPFKEALVAPVSGSAIAPAFSQQSLQGTLHPKEPPCPRSCSLVQWAISSSWAAPEILSSGHLCQTATKWRVLYSQDLFMELDTPTLGPALKMTSPFLTSPSILSFP